MRQVTVALVALAVLGIFGCASKEETGIVIAWCGYAVKGHGTRKTIFGGFPCPDIAAPVIQESL